MMQFETWSDVEALPVSTKVTPGLGMYGVNGRDAVTTWVLRGEEGLPSIVVRLRTSHWKDRKEFSSVLTHEALETTDGYTVASWSSDYRMVRLYREPVARYSAKALEAAHENALAAMQAQFEGYGPATSVFADAIDKHGLNETEEEYA